MVNVETLEGSAREIRMTVPLTQHEASSAAPAELSALRPHKEQTLFETSFVRMKQIDRWQFVERPNCTGAVTILPLTANDEVILIDQYRIPLGRRAIDFPAGLVGDAEGERDEDFAIAASRELLEEAGYAAPQLVELFDRPTASGLSNEVVKFYLASPAEKVAPGGGVDGEDIAVHKVPLGQIDSWLRRREAEGYMVDPKIDIGLRYLEKLVRNRHYAPAVDSFVDVTHDRVLGMLYGVAIGDMLGLPFETKTAEQIARSLRDGSVHEPGDEASDDTQLTLCVMDALTKSGAFDMQSLVQMHVDALHQSTKGWGGTTRDAIRRIDEGVPWQEASLTFLEGRGEGNGVAMKISPFAVYSALQSSDEKQLVSQITDLTRMTHGTNVAVCSALAQTGALLYCLSVTPERFSAVDFLETVIHYSTLGETAIEYSPSGKPLTNKLRGIANATGPLLTEGARGCSHVMESLPVAYRAFLKYPQSSDAMITAVCAGGDTDTNASLAGALLGALHGTAIFPPELIESLPNREALELAVGAFCRKFNVD